MGKTQYTKCVELLNKIGKREISFEELTNLISINIGNDKYRVIRPCFDLMLRNKLIEEIEYGKFRIL